MPVYYILWVWVLCQLPSSTRYGKIKNTSEYQINHIAGNGAEDTMITCKLCNTRLEKKDLRRDGSMLCPECGQIYWKAAVDKVMREEAINKRSTRRVA